MDDRHAHFLISIGDLCTMAALAGLDVEVITSKPTPIRGVPAPTHTDGNDQVSDTGYARTLHIGNHTVNLDDITACTIHAPDPDRRRHQPTPDRPDPRLTRR